MKRGDTLVLFIFLTFIFTIIPVNANSDTGLFEQKGTLIQPRFTNITVFYNDFYITDQGKAVKADRINYIQKMAKEAGEKKVSGVLAYNDYYSIDAIYDMLRKYQNSITIEEVWFSIPGESGKNMSKVKSNDIKSAISNFIQAMQTDYYNIEDFAAKKEQYRIFALTFTSKYHFVDNMLKDDMIELIDIFDYPEVEKEALDKQKRISYIAFPQKPEKEVGE